MKSSPARLVRRPPARRSRAAVHVTASLCVLLAACSEPPDRSQMPVPVVQEESRALPRVPLRRLTHTQYDNTVRDLLRIAARPGRAFPPEDTSHGFDTLAEVLSMPPLLVEKYDAAAALLARDAWTADAAPAMHEHREAEGLSNTVGRYQSPGTWKFNGNGEISSTFELPATGEYTFSARAAGNVVLGEATQMAFALDGVEFARFHVTAPLSAMEVFWAAAPASAGVHTFAVVFDN
ncbi:MAG: DUF1587 domain-containing protein, partial [Myxococcales bacterium]